MNFDLIIKEIIKIIRHYLNKEDYKIYLFGSWARGDALPTSDIDIGIFGKEKIPFDIMSKILSEKEAVQTLRSLDVIDLNTKNQEFKNKALKEAKLLD
ncbi:MAG: nucleotidyltransferase domain-containing protein [Parcubacteria group bacterium]|nr:nucleotidyltransferase domain-containing protein [Parcubacteria group bacterium]